MMAGRVPFKQSDSSHLAMGECCGRIATSPPPLIREIAPDREFPAPVIELVMECLAKDPKQRPSSVSVIRERFLEGMRPLISAPRATDHSMTIRPGDVFTSRQTDSDWRGTRPPPIQPHRIPWLWILIAPLILVGLLAAAMKLMPPTYSSLPRAIVFLDATKIHDGGHVKWKAEETIKLMVDLENLLPNESPNFEHEFEPQGVSEIEVTQRKVNDSQAIFELSIKDLNALATSSLERKLTLLAKFPSQKTPVRTSISLEIIKPEPWLPDENTKHPLIPSTDSRLYRIGKMVFASVLECSVASRKARFRLVPGRTISGMPVKTFYIAEELVTNEMFNEFAVKSLDFVQIPNAVSDREFSKPLNADFPVASVGVLEAQQFAQWLLGTNGSLPTIVEWDLASGYYDFKDLVKSRYQSEFIPMEESKSDAFIGQDWPISSMGTKSWIGLGPALCKFRDVDGKERPNHSPYGCSFSKLLQTGELPLEMTATLLGTATTEDLRVICPSGKVDGRELDEIGSRIRSLEREKNQRLWIHRDGVKDRVAKEGEFDNGHDRELALTSSQNSFLILIGKDIGFRVVLLTER